MVSDEEIISKINSTSEGEGIRWSIGLVGQDRSYLKTLLRLLRETEKGITSQRIAGTLGELGIASDEVLEALIGCGEDNPKYYGVRRDAAQAIVKLAPNNIDFIIRHLDDNNGWTVEVCANAVSKIKAYQALPALVRAVRKFPYNFQCIDSLRILSGEQFPQYILMAFRGAPVGSRSSFLRAILRNSFFRFDTLRYLYWHLSNGERLSLDRILPDEWFHELHFHKGFYHLLNRLMAQTHSEEEAFARMRQAMGFVPLKTLVNLTSIEDLTSLRMNERLEYEEINLIRFAALRERGETPNGNPIAEIMLQHDISIERMLELEAEFDSVREEIALLRRRLRILLEVEAVFLALGKQSEKERKEEESSANIETFEKIDKLIDEVDQAHLQQVQATIQDVSQKIEQLKHRIEKQGEGSLPTLRRATERLLPILRQIGVRFKQLDIEGVLGEYDFIEYKVILYPPMIELAARDLAKTFSLSAKVEEIVWTLSTVVDIHETAHANLHLGKDSDGKQWDKLTDCSVSLHEGLAQFYTYALIKQIGDKKLIDAFKSLSEKQPEDYKLWSLLEPCSLEQLRHFVLAQRNSNRWPTIFEVTSEAMQIVSINRKWIRRRTGEEGWQAFTSLISSAASKVRNAKSSVQLAMASNHLLNVCASCPAVKLLLDGMLTGSFPSEENRSLLQMAAVCQKPPAANSYSRTRLRAINLNTATMTVALSPEEQGVSNTIIEATRIIQFTQPGKPEQLNTKSKGWRRKKNRRIVFRSDDE